MHRHKRAPHLTTHTGTVPSPPTPNIPFSQPSRYPCHSSACVYVHTYITFICLCCWLLCAMCLNVAGVVLLLKSIWSSNMYMHTAIYSTYSYINIHARICMDRHSGQWIKNAKDDLQKLKAGWPSASICGFLYFPFTYECECTPFGQVEALREEDLKGEGQQLFDGQRKVFTKEKNALTNSLVGIIHCTNPRCSPTFHMHI